MSLQIQAGATDQTVYVFIQNSSLTTGAGLTGLVFNSAGLTAYYCRERTASAVITLVTLASATAAHSDGGFIEVDATNMPGVYRLDLPDAAVSSGMESIILLKGATNMSPVAKEIHLIAFNPQVANLAANVTTMAANVITASALATDAVTEMAEGLLKIDMSTITGEASRSPLNALRILRNKISTVSTPGNVDVFKENDATLAWTAALTTSSSADPITSVDPT